MKARYTDQHRYPHGYTRSEATDVRETFRRARKKDAENKQEAERKVIAEIKPRLRAKA